LLLFLFAANINPYLAYIPCDIYCLFPSSIIILSLSIENLVSIINPDNTPALVSVKAKHPKSCPILLNIDS
jgi:hypothetical protein